MCGIGGILLTAASVPDPSALETMGLSMYSRGPDDSGVHVGTHIGLVHRRLTIRDLSDAGRCPMAALDGQLQLVFNGEIYNWRELRTQLQESGSTFTTQTDTEVVLRGYEAWGDNVVHKLRGMFALALWDSRHRRLLLARDRAGEKPLFYTMTAEGLLFASTIQALEGQLATRALDTTGLAAYLSHTFIPAGHTIWQGVQALPPGHLMVVVVSSQPSIQSYWEFPRRMPARRSMRDSASLVEAALDDSVLRCLDADVPVGVFLSGGVDSSVIAALASRHQPGICAFSLGFDEAEYNELPYAQRVAAHLGVDHHVVTIGVDDVIACLPHLVREYGQPFGDASAVPTHLLSRFARQRVKVCLSGDGGDESFGGYWRMQAGVYAARYRQMTPHWLRTKLVPRMVPHLGALGVRLDAMNRLATVDQHAAYTNSQSWFDHLQAIAGPRFRPPGQAELVALRVGKALQRENASIVQRLLFDDFQVQLPDDYLTKVDVASMAASLEVRAPFLDQTVVELAWTLPDAMKLNWGRRKWLLKEIAKRLVPPDTVTRRKMGFAMPLRDWFRGRLGEHLESLLQDSVAAHWGWIRPEPVLDCLRAHRSGSRHETRLWLVLWLELWCRQIAGGPFASPRVV